ncbi:unnamed protein product [Gongylonema pulchrum]|uniref:Nucleolar protein 9 n=1 Tax=Gongylonema pulchrum TaxID=637853 RepID=A0A183DBZ5_9BILA|nr:unnamed protein product [Gongylonema pulchrum]
MGKKKKSKRKKKQNKTEQHDQEPERDLERELELWEPKQEQKTWDPKKQRQFWSNIAPAELASVLKIPDEELDEYHSNVMPEVLELVKPITALIRGLARTRASFTIMLTEGAALITGYQRSFGEAGLKNLEAIFQRKPWKKSDQKGSSGILGCYIAEAVCVVKEAGQAVFNEKAMNEIYQLVILHVVQFFEQIARQMQSRDDIPGVATVSFFHFVFLGTVVKSFELIRPVQKQALLLFHVLAQKTGHQVRLIHRFPELLLLADVKLGVCNNYLHSVLLGDCC